MKIRFVTLGCKLNFAESSALGKELMLRGHERASLSDVPDVCVVNTCSVTDAADHKDRQMINQLHRKYPDATIIVTGCYAQLQPEQIGGMAGVDYVLGQNEKYDIPSLVDEIERSRNSMEQVGDKIRVAAIREVDDFHGVYSADDRTRCFIKVQDGCNYFCTYCTIPYARGKSRNAKIVDVIEDAQRAIDNGAKELIITGVNIGDFGRSTGERFIDLLRDFDALRGVYRVRISSCEPNLLTDEVIDFVSQSQHFAPHFHIPLQSGSNEVLSIMKRRYTRELFAERVSHIREVMPHAFIGVDCMVGVRGETEACWQDYLSFVRLLDVSQLHVFTYSERANTRMLDMDLYVVPKVERQRRSKVLHEVSEQKTEAFYAKHAGRKSVVLWESKKEGDQMSGFTDNYIKVYGPYDRAKINTFEEILL